ncbi:MAG: hypothetical protein HYR77_12185 [Ignavibacteria bacterium]|nr:hypothetical protein [Ignavibacteria bacterium]
MIFNQSNIVLTVIQYLVVAIGLVMVVYGFMNDADLIEFFGIALAMVPFFVRNYIETTRKQNSISTHDTH